MSVKERKSLKNWKNMDHKEWMNVKYLFHMHIQDIQLQTALGEEMEQQ